MRAYTTTSSEEEEGEDVATLLLQYLALDKPLELRPFEVVELEVKAQLGPLAL